MKVKSAPAWLTFSAGEVPAQRIVFTGVSAAKDAPAGEHQVEVMLEIANLHVAPGKALTVSLPLHVQVAE
jgi:hypothetical protein